MRQMKNILIFGVVAIFALALGSCSKANPEMPENPNAGGLTVKIELPTASTRAAGTSEEGTDDENKIENLKVFVLDNRDGMSPVIERVYDFAPSEDKLFDDGTRWNAANQVMEVSEFQDMTIDRIIYVVANWYPDNFADYEVGQDIGKLFFAVTVNTAEGTAPFVMSRYVRDVNFSYEKNVSVKLVRQPIKVEMSVVLDNDFAAAYHDFNFGTLDELTKSTMGVLSTPNSSQVHNDWYDQEYGYVNIAAKDMTEDDQNGKKTWKASFYLYENDKFDLLEKNATKFVLSLPYQKNGGEIKTDNYYTITLKTDDATNPYQTTRNTIYRVKATLLGFGSTTPVDLDNKVETVVTAAPWDEYAYDDQIIGAKLGVNLSRINIRGEVASTQLVVTSDDLSKVEFTDYAPLLQKPTIDLTTGVVSVNTATPIGLYTANYTRFKVKRGGITKIITVSAGLWATGNIIYKKRTADVNDNTGDYINSPNNTDNGLYFFVNSNRGLQYGAGNGSKWSATSKYYYWWSQTHAFGEYTNVADWNSAALKSLGDPCRVILPENTWRLPNQADFNSLKANSGAKDNVKKGQYFYNNTVFIRWAGCSISGTMNFYDAGGMYWVKEGSQDLRILTNSTQLDCSNSFLPEENNFSVRCVHN